MKSEKPLYPIRPKATDATARRLVKKLARLQENGGGKSTTDWEKTFIDEVKSRVGRFGSAFCDPEKGDLNNPLSFRQNYKMHEISRLIRYRAKKRVK